MKSGPAECPPSTPSYSTLKPPSFLFGLNTFVVVVFGGLRATHAATRTYATQERNNEEPVQRKEDRSEQPIKSKILHRVPSIEVCTVSTRAPNGY